MNMPGYRLRRTKALPAEPMHRLLTFQLRNDWFALPIQVAQKVVPLPSDGEVMGPAGVGLMLLQGKEISLIDLEGAIYRNVPMPVLPGQGMAEPTTALVQSPRYVLIVQLLPTDPLGLIIQAPPVLRRVPQSAFSPVPSVYLLMSHMQGIRGLVTIPEREAPLFLLDLTQLVPDTSTLQLPGAIQ